ncbi:hypothetical protein ZYGR_0A00850 [Zygosaccharomyces rouxii]|uniref:non-specific serine/threonine protein kinase n=2 Tax=Zygosaccharomyces rouxii TaxID=4956 RepID=C5DPB0_ZYGRC|nr:uncharacterized protein ZYRO0A01848g [Zygosaccharomyces rouxii]KAH9198959.1 kinase-like domain-containing protein [Zygosaccharomyces rouxii]GAV46493.1 hypothetical protein ZYGR_0A00850 [Zygosaccharomyces rouxii]CAR25521.1 ZYRO0A01848p [Zygosaccharomyces rouxii]
MNHPEIPTYTPGTVLSVGTHHAKILKYIASGGFAQVYSAEMFPADTPTGTNKVCLKRVIIPEKAGLNALRAEVNAMKLLKGSKHVVCYIDSHAARSLLQNGTYEVFLLMEFCTAGGLIDFMNTRLQNRLKEYEILNIMSQVTQGIAAMHALQPPLIHRDIKIENVLISADGEYKVCDFGSVSGPIRPPRNPQEFAFVQHDILKNTTAQYRSPEMIDLYRCQAIDEKSDIWALGIFLYKLCYYTTPFEKGGDQAILHSRYQFLAHPIYSDRLKNLISWMLSQQPMQRPNICQVLEEVSRMQGVSSPMRNFYLLRAMQHTNTSTSFITPPVSMVNTNTFMAPPAQVAPLTPAQSLGANGMPVGVTPQPMPIMAKTRSGISTGGNIFPGAANPMVVPTQLGPAQVAGPVPMGSQDMSSGILPPFNRASTLPTDGFSTGPGKDGGVITSAVNTGPETIKDRPFNYVDSETQTSDAGSITTSKPYLHPSAVSSTRSLPAQNADHDSRPRSSSLDFKSAARKKPADEEILENLIALSNRRDDPNKRNSFNSFNSSPIGQRSPTGGANVPTTPDSLARIKSNPDTKESIQKKVQSLLKAAEDSPKNKSTSEIVNIRTTTSSFSENGLRKTTSNVENGKSTTRSIKTPSSVNGKSESKSKPPPPPPKPEHLRPKKPPKPAFLSGKRKEPEVLLNEVKDAVMDSNVDTIETDV